MVTHRVTKTRDSHNAIRESYSWIRPILWHREAHGLSCRCGSHHILITFAVLDSDTLRSFLICQEALEVMDTGQLVSRMIETRILNSHIITRLYRGHDLIVDHNLTMTRLSGEDLINTLACGVGQTNNVATHGEMKRIAAIVILCNALGRETIIRSGISTECRTS